MLESHDELCFYARSLYAPCIIPPCCLEVPLGTSYYAHEDSKPPADRPFPEGRQYELSGLRPDACELMGVLLLEV